MIKKLQKFVKNYELLSVFLLLLVVVAISYGRTVNMYWWVDDWGLLYKMVNPNISPGNLGSPAYRFLATPFIILYPIFGKNAQPYFILGLVQYVVAAYVVYLFVRELTDSKKLSLGASVIFASGYIGSFALYRLSNSYQLSDTTILIYLSGYFLLKYFKSKGRKRFYLNYLFSLLAYFAAIYLTFLRAHGIIAVIGVLFIFHIIRNWKDEKKLLLRRTIELVPFLWIYIYFYFFQGGSEAAGTAGSNYLSKIIDELVIKKNLFLINNLMRSFSSVLVPNPWIHDIFTFAKKHTTFVANYVVNDKPWIMFTGWLFLLASLILPLYKKYRHILIYLPLASIFVLGSVLTYFVYMPTSGLQSFNRYLMPSFVGSALFYSCIFLAFSEKLKKKRPFLGKISFGFLVILLSVGLIRLSHGWQDEILKYISYPTQDALKVIRSVIPKIDEKTVVFLDAEDDPHVKNNVLSGMSWLAISIQYNHNKRTKVIRHYDELCGEIFNNEISIPDLYTFFASEKGGFVSTTDQFKSELYKKLPSKKITGWVDKKNYIQTEVGFPSLMPTKVNLTISLTALPGSTEKLLPIRVSWLTQRARDYVSKYSKEFNMIPDGRPRNYSVIIPAGGLSVEGIRIEGHPPHKLEVLNASIVNLTIPEVAAEDSLDCK